uniref:Uncharacterized protein n=1 Tax=Oryza meridionalis TaxID=40149 RepID=A0A0E0DYE3_9ORYZ
MACVVPMIIVLAMGGGALGGPEALRLLLTFAGRSPLVDIGIVVFVIAALTAPALGTMLLACFYRTPRGARGAAAAAAADLLAKMTLAVSMAVALLVSASLLVLPLFQSGDVGPLLLLLAFAVAAFVVCASAGRIRCVAHLRRARPRNASGAATDAGRTAMTTLMVSLAAACFLLGSCVAVGGIDAHHLFTPFALKNPLVHAPTGVAIATVVGTTLLFLFFRKARNAAATAAAATAPLPAKERAAKIISDGANPGGGCT